MFKRVLYKVSSKPLLLVLGFFTILEVIYFFPVIKGLVPIPLDVLTGAYFPWLDYKWGYLVGVPVKNPSLSDVFATIYPWRIVAIDIIKQGQWPLWNPYVLSGMPLLANWQSAPLYPFNILMLILGNLPGWTLMIILQPFLSMIWMYWLLKQLKVTQIPAITGSVIFAFSGFMMTYLEYNTGGQAFLWLPLLLFLLEKYLVNEKIKYLLLIPLVIFCIITAGFFQPALYTLIIGFVYLLFRSLLDNQSKNTHDLLKKFITGSMALVLGFGLSAVQLIPTIELILRSIRSLDHNIVEYQYGLLPLKNIVTFFIPDFYGNPVTGNFWGFMGYQETTGYFGIITFIFIIYALSKYKKNILIIFFAMVFLISFILSFDTPLGHIIYVLKIPFLSTGYASRMLYMTSFSAAILGAFGMDYWLKEIKSQKKSLVLSSGVVIWAIIAGIILGLFICLRLNRQYITIVPLVENINVAFRNSLIPAAIISTFLLSLLVIKSRKVTALIALTIISYDLLKFGIKFTPFVPAKLDFPVTPVVEYLQKNSGFFRIDRERTETLPPDTWMPYHLMSSSGYDPLTIKNYSQFYNVYNDNQPGSNYSRYSELDQVNSQFTDLAGMKFLLAAKRDNKNVIDLKSSSPSYKIDLNKYQQVFDDKTTLVLENKSVMPRVMLFNDYLVIPDELEALRLLKNNFDFRQKVILDQSISFTASQSQLESKAEIVKYQPNTVTIKASSSQPAILMLTDTNYPGWQVSVNGVEQPMLTTDGIFRGVAIPQGDSEIIFSYQPLSFKIGLMISLFSLSVVLLGSLLIIISGRNYRA